jgi:hypothetical protein
VQRKLDKSQHDQQLGKKENDRGNALRAPLSFWSDGELRSWRLRLFDVNWNVEIDTCARNGEFTPY